jgi:hypothetical protein
MSASDQFVDVFSISNHLFIANLLSYIPSLFKLIIQLTPKLRLFDLSYTTTRLK